MEIQELHDYTAKELERMKQLMSELSERIVLTEGVLQQVMSDDNSHLYVLVDEGQIVGCATLCVFHAPSGTKASIEDVVVTSDCRGKHLGKQLVEYLMTEATKYAPIDLQLTSKPKRIAANKMYQALGFERKETNCYTKSIPLSK